jgi:hypothetical protein
MTPGEAWLRYHTLRRWAAKVAADGPDMSLLRFMPLSAIVAAHEARLAGLDAQLRTRRDEAERLTLARMEAA